MAKRIKVQFPEKCNGCEMCIFETQRQLQKIGLEGSLVRVLRRKGFYIELDPKINHLDILKVKNICPTGVFVITEEEEDEFGE